MAEISVSLVTIISVVFGGIMGALISKYVFNKDKRQQHDVLISRAARAEEQLTSSADTIISLESNIREISTSLKEVLTRESQLQAERIKYDAEKLKAREEARQEGYEKGAKESLKDYKIIYQPFINVDDGWFLKSTKGGFRYQFYVKGIPIFNPIDVIVQESNKVDENAKAAVLNAVNSAINIAVTQWGDMPTESLPPAEDFKSVE